MRSSKQVQHRLPTTREGHGGYLKAMPTPASAPPTVEDE